MVSGLTLVIVFLAGFLTVLTPCIFTVLPAVLSGSIGSRLRPLAIVTGMAVTFTAMGTLISALGSLFSPVTDYLRWVSVFVIISMGAILFDEEIHNIFVKFSSAIVQGTKDRLSFLGPLGAKLPEEEGLAGGLLLGMSLGILWIPCVGPILGAVLAYVGGTSAESGSVFVGSLLLLVYSIGVGVPMLVIAYSGKKISSKNNWFMKNNDKLKKLSGLVLIFIGIMMLFGIDKFLQGYALRNFNWFTFDDWLLKKFGIKLDL